MIVRCLGGWSDLLVHEPAIIGVKEPLADTTVTDGACDRCCRAMRVMIKCRWCGAADTAGGLCSPCDRALQTKMGESLIELTVFRAGAQPLTCSYDGVGAVLRLRGAMNAPSYCGFALRRLSEVSR